jgi:serine phosphatase RsbU (regulator of sigma subunit)
VPSMRKRLMLLGVLGVLLSLAVAGVALASLAEVSQVNRELARVNRVLHHHQRADEMHDALRADVAVAELIKAGASGVDADELEHDTIRHGAQYLTSARIALAANVDPDIEHALNRLRPEQENYVVLAQQLVASVVDGAPDSPRDQPEYQLDLASYKAGYRSLVPLQANLSSRLMARAERVEREAVEEKARADRVIVLAAAAALAGWLVAVTWHLHSIRRLQGALVREAEQRSAADMLQRSLMPDRLPPLHSAQLAARSIPGTSGHRVGGDWYDVIKLPDGRVCLVVGDVVGHDLPAAAVMGQLRHTLRAYALEDASPAEVLRRVNRAAYLNDQSDLATCIVAVLDPATMRLEWSSAGHLPPLLVRAAGVGTLLAGEPGPPLGVTTEGDFPRHHVRLGPSDTLLLYSDGLVERRGTPIDSGLAELQAVEVAQLSPDAMCDQILASLLDEHAEHEDDVTLLLLHVDEKATVRAGDRSTSVAGV